MKDRVYVIGVGMTPIVKQEGGSFEHQCNMAISEAMELAKQYGTEDSGRFVNGVLGKIVRAQESPSGEEP